jgi:hypothetical protein
MRPVALDLHLEDVLVGEPAGLGRQPAAKLFADVHVGKPGRGEEVLDGSADDDVADRRGAEGERAGALVGVHEHRRPVLASDAVDRLHVVRAAGPEGDERRRDQRRPLVDGGRIRLRLGLHVDDLGAAQLLRVRDLADRRELVLRDDDPVSLTGEVDPAHEGAHRGGDGGLDRDLVRPDLEQAGEAAAHRLGPLDPVLPLGPVPVPPVEVLHVRRPHCVGQRSLRARVDVDLVAEDRESAPDRLADLARPVRHRVRHRV